MPMAPLSRIYPVTLLITLWLMGSTCVAAGDVEYLQKWSERNWFYTFSQGSQLLPYEWFIHLEMPDSETAFIADGLSRYGYIPGEVVPVGFAMDHALDGDWIGLTCAACHTARIQFSNRTLQVDGGPGGGDLNGLFDGLAAALRATVSDKDKFARFALSVLPQPVDQDQLHDFRAQLGVAAAKFERFSDDSRPQQTTGLPGRTDAFRLIFNRVFSIDLNNYRANTKTPEAPVRYPRLWGTNEFRRAQWTGNLDNTDSLNKLGRNIGEALGVFARMPSLGSWNSELHRYRSTALLDQLFRVDQAIAQLPSPAWPGKPIDPIKADRGSKIYHGIRIDLPGVNCAGCHADVPQGAKIVETPRIALADLGTDSRAAVQLACDMSETGPLLGQLVVGLTAKPAGVKESSIDLLTGVVLHTMLVDQLYEWSPLTSPNAKGPFAKPQLFVRQGAAGDCENLKELKYKGAPLTGIWATAPYLHNGSVPTLVDLLKPASARPKTFSMNVGLYDESNVGIDVNGKTGPMLDTSLWGNRNSGHEGVAYGTELSDSDKQDLLEYLKSL